ncbi:ATPase associated with various cellular activities family protein [Clostridioides difficile CD160]|nr:ATPase associated with various cellular activities family protein [Clostridioides difficile CD160]
MEVCMTEINQDIKRELLTCNLLEYKKIIKDAISYFQNSNIEFKKNNFASSILLEENSYFSKDILLDARKGYKNINFLLYKASDFNNYFDFLGQNKLHDKFSLAKSLSPCFLQIDDIDELNTFCQNILAKELNSLKGKIIFIGTVSGKKGLEKVLSKNNYFDKLIKINRKDNYIEKLLIKYDFKLINDFPINLLYCASKDIRLTELTHILCLARIKSEQENFEGIISIEHFNKALRKYNKSSYKHKKIDLNQL